MKGSYKSSFKKLTLLSSRASAHTRLLDNFKGGNFLPKPTIIVNIKYNPVKKFSIFGENQTDLFLKKQECLKFLSLLNRSKAFYNFNFYKHKRIKVKFRKRKKIFFNLALHKPLPREKNFFFFLPSLIGLVKRYSTYIHLNYGLDIRCIKIKETKRTLKFYLLNLQIFLAFFHNLNFTKNQYLFVIKLNFSNFLDKPAKEALFYYLQPLDEKIKI